MTRCTKVHLGDKPCHRAKNHSEALKTMSRDAENHGQCISEARSENDHIQPCSPKKYKNRKHCTKVHPGEECNTAKSHSELTMLYSQETLSRGVNHSTKGRSEICPKNCKQPVLGNSIDNSIDAE